MKIFSGFRKSALVKINLVLVLSIILMGCGTILRGPMTLPMDKYKSNYDKMFEAAIAAAAKDEFSVEYQDRKNGLLKFHKKIGAENSRVNVQFLEDKLENGEPIGIVKIGGFATRITFTNIENAIRKAVGIEEIPPCTKVLGKCL